MLPLFGVFRKCQVCTMAHVWRSEDNLQKLVYVLPGDDTQLPRLGSQCFTSLATWLAPVAETFNSGAQSEKPCLWSPTVAAGSPSTLSLCSSPSVTGSAWVTCLRSPLTLYHLGKSSGGNLPRLPLLSPGQENSGEERVIKTNLRVLRKEG